MSPTPEETSGQQAACQDQDPELFWPISEYDTGRIEQAKEICGGCGLRAQCLQLALATGEQGIWGGTTENERAALRHRSRLTVVPAPGIEDGQPGFGEAAA